MKTRIVKTEKEKTFTPFTLEITVESIEEARLLYHLFNAGAGVLPRLLKGNNSVLDTDRIAKDLGSEGWKNIRNEVESQGFSVV